METPEANTNATSAGLTPPTASEGVDPQVPQLEQLLVRKLVGLIGGRIVNYVMLDGEVRPMLVVNPWDGSGLINGLLFFDGVNDAKRHVIHLGTEPSGAVPVFAKLIASVEYSEDVVPGTWHWPQKQQVIASGIDPNALATQLMGVNENALQKTARELEIRTLDLVNEKLNAHLNAVNETLDSFKELLETFSAGNAERATQSLETIQAASPVAQVVAPAVGGTASGDAGEGSSEAKGEQTANAATAVAGEGTGQADAASGGAQTAS